MNQSEKEIFEIETDFIRIRQTRINEIVAATHAGLHVGNIDLSVVDQLAEAKHEAQNFFELLDELKDTTMNEQEKEAIRSEFEKWLKEEQEKQA